MKTRLAERLLELRKASKKKGYLGVRSWSRQDVASAAGLSLSSYERIERGKASPSLDSVDRLAHVFGLTVSELLA